MLSECNKRFLICVATEYPQKCQQSGPAGVIDLTAKHLEGQMVITGCPEELKHKIRSSLKNLLDNRKEAEQILAGLLGMM